MTRSNPRAIVTGGASGLGLESARTLAQRGYHVIVADRNVAGGEAAVAMIRQGGGSAEFRALDLASLAAARRFASDELDRGEPLGLLLNNAGLLPPARRATTQDGFELGFGVSYLGHFALTGLLLPALLRSEAPRVVSVSSNSHPGGRIDFGNLQLERGYSASGAYTNSKLACLMFAFELQRRADAAGITLLSVAAHPGVSRTSIAAGWASEERRGIRERFELIGYQAFMRFFDRDAAEGARSLILAATTPEVVPGGYYGPTGLLQGRGEPGLTKPARRALDTVVAARLWQASEELTGVRWVLRAVSRAAA
ncbi:MAG TPA: SDR family NAD(P)-dependent oxidoreductase [Solimonas sp.]|nr:SDR family NAD(P)-dependent oxidoreductase [Solimonas sp.]